MDPISIATAAFGAIKSGIEVGKELNSLSGHIIKFVKQMSDVEEEHKKEKNKWFTSSNEEALHTYFALKQVHDMENQLREIFTWHGAPGAWSEFVAIRTDIRKKRQAAEAKRRAQKKQFMINCSYALLAVTLIGFVGFLIMMLN
tara:strand:+ start:239 stop:670 length:432 start_codon:yes stop_codon:yes gene_type:complete